MNTFVVGAADVDSVAVGGGGRFFLICGPCVIESRDQTMQHAEAISRITRTLGIPLIYKSSFDKANRTSAGSFRGVGMEEGLEILAEVRREFSLPVVTDIHHPEEAAPVGSVVDLLQIPAFLCRQTDLLLAAGAVKKPVMVKKGQFLHPEDMRFAAEKMNDSPVLLCERGTSFGYRELVVDFRALAIMSQFGYPVVLDATHSVQVIGGRGGSSGGNRKFVPLLARAGVAAGLDGVFLESHLSPDAAPSDGPNMIPVSELAALLQTLLRIADACQ